MPASGWLAIGSILAALAAPSIGGARRRPARGEPGARWPEPRRGAGRTLVVPGARDRADSARPSLGVPARRAARSPTDRRPGPGRQRAVDRDRRVRRVGSRREPGRDACASPSPVDVRLAATLPRYPADRARDGGRRRRDRSGRRRTTIHTATTFAGPACRARFGRARSRSGRRRRSRPTRSSDCGAAPELRWRRRSRSRRRASRPGSSSGCAIGSIATSRPTSRPSAPVTSWRSRAGTSRSSRRASPRLVAALARRRRAVLTATAIVVYVAVRRRIRLGGPRGGDGRRRAARAGERPRRAGRRRHSAGRRSCCSSSTLTSSATRASSSRASRRRESWRGRRRCGAWLTAAGRGRLPGWLVECLAVSLAAQAATLPVVLVTFGRLAHHLADREPGDRAARRAGDGRERHRARRRDRRDVRGASPRRDGPRPARLVPPVGHGRDRRGRRRACRSRARPSSRRGTSSAASAPRFSRVAILAIRRHRTTRSRRRRLPRRPSVSATAGRSADRRGGDCRSRSSRPASRSHIARTVRRGSPSWTSGRATRSSSRAIAVGECSSTAARTPIGCSSSSIGGFRHGTGGSMSSC